VIFSITWAVVSSLAGTLIPLHLTILAAGFLGAFMGSSPLMLVPMTARWSLGPKSRFAEPRRIEGQLFLLFTAALTTAALILFAWPHETWTQRTIGELGLIAAIVGGVFVREFTAGARHWLRRKLGAFGG
jgi:hypothetical protein